MFRTVFVALLVLTAGLARADNPISKLDKEGIWSLAGEEVMRFRRDSDGRSPLLRAAEVSRRLNEIMSTSERYRIDRDEITMRRVRGGVKIEIKGRLLVMITHADAAASGQSVRSLARYWLANLRRTVPQVTPIVNRRGA